MATKLTQFAGRDDTFVRRYEYDDGTTVAVDMNDPEADADLVGDTLMIVGGDGDQVDLDLPGEAGDDADVFIRNGVLTIEVKA